MSTAPVTFTGSSQFSSDFQQVITRAVGIATLPITQLQTAETALQSQSTEVSSVNSLFTALQTAVNGLQTSTGASSYSASSSDPSVVTANTSAGATAGSYSIEVTKLGSFSNSVSNDGLTTVSDPTTQSISSDGSYSLSVGGVSSTITPAANNLDSLVSAINSQSSLNVQAAIVNVGSSGSPDYRLTLQSTKLGPVALELNGASGNLLNQVATGSLATYKLNGLTSEITSDSRTITLAPDVTVSLLAQSATGVATTVSVAQSAEGISGALSNFVSAYNATVDEVNKNYGTSGGALTGQSLVFGLSRTLSGLSTYNGGGSSGISSLADLGITLNSTGDLALDTTAFSTAAAGNLSGVIAFLGDATSGFLGSAATLINSVEDPQSGSLVLQSASLTSQITKSDAAIATDQDRVTRMQTDLTNRLAAADAAIATLEQQVSNITALFTAETAATNSNNQA